MNKELIQVSSKLMQNYHLGHPVSAGTQIATFSNHLGQVEVLSIGSDFKLYHFYPDTSGTTWAMKQIELPDNALAKEVVAGTQIGMPVILVKTDKIFKGQGVMPIPLIGFWLYSETDRTFLPSYLKTVDGDFGSNSYGIDQWRHVPVDPDSIFLLSRQFPKNLVDHPKHPDVRLGYSGIGTKDNFLYTHIVEVGSQPSYVRLISRSSQQAKDISSTALLHYKDQSPNKVATGTVVANSKDNPTPENFNRVEFISRDTNSSRNFAQGAENQCSKVATTHLPNAAFAIRTKDKALVYLTSEASRSNGKCNLTVLSDIEGENGEIIHQEMSQVYASSDQNQRPIAFTLDEEGNLYHTELKEDGTWSPLAIVESHEKFQHLSITKDGTGNPIIFGVTKKASGTKAGQLWRIWLDTEIELWQTEEIEIESSTKTDRKAHEFNTYSTEIAVYDKAGVLRPNAKVQIWSSGSQNLIINGKGYLTNKQHHVKVNSNEAGRITIISPTNDIATSIIHVWTEFMDDDKGVAIQANGEIQDKFSKITSDELLAAQGQSGNLLKGKYQNQETAQNMADALRSSMAIIEHSAKADSKLKHANYSRVISGSKCHHVMSESFGQRLRINADQNYTESWKLSFAGADGLPVYSNLTYRKDFHQSYKRDTQPLVMEEHGFFDFLSDVWRMVKEGVANLVEIVVNGIQTAVTVLIDGVHKIWRGIVNFVDEIFQAVLGFFERVEVFFVDIFHWLGTIFNWENIMRTRAVINHSFNEVLDFISGPVIDYVKNKVDDEISKLEVSIHETIQKYIREIVGDKPLISYEDQQRHNTSEVLSVENNMMTYAVTNNYKDADDVKIGDVHESISAAFNELEPISNEFSSSKEWAKAKAYFLQIHSHPDQILELALAGLLELVDAILIWGLEKIKGAIDAIFKAISELIKAIKSAINKPFYIPLVTEIYNLVTQKDKDNPGLPFSYLDVGSMIVAMPTTVFSTLLTGKAPFPDDESVIAFKQYFTKDWLSQKIGINKSLRQNAPETDTDLRVLNNFFNVLSGVIYCETAIIKPIVDSATIGHEAFNLPPKPILKFLSFSEAYLNTIGWIASTPWALEPKEEFDTPGFILQTRNWLVELIDDVFIDWLFFVIDAEGKTESIVTTFFSAINLGLYIDLAVIDPKRGFNICKTFPGIFSVGRPISAQLPKPYGPPAGAAVLSFIDMVSFGVMAGYSFDAVKSENKPTD